MHQPTLRVLEIIEYASKSAEGKRLADFSKDLKIPKSTLLPILQTLCSRRYLFCSDGLYQVGTSLFSLATAFSGMFPTLSFVHKQLEALVEILGETCYFGVLEDTEVLYIDKVDSPQPLRMLISTGKKLAAYATGIGKALLIDKTLEELKELYPDNLTPITENTVSDITALSEQLKKARDSGFAYEVEESAEHIRCFAVPIRKGGKIIAAISVAIPVFRFVNGSEGAIIATLKNTAEIIGKTIEETDAHFGGAF